MRPRNHFNSYLNLKLWKMMRDTNGRFELWGKCTNAVIFKFRQDGRTQIKHIFIFWQLGDETWWPSLFFPYMELKKPNWTTFVVYWLNLQCEFLNGDDDDVTCVCGWGRWRPSRPSSWWWSCGCWRFDSWTRRGSCTTSVFIRASFKKTKNKNRNNHFRPKEVLGLMGNVVCLVFWTLTLLSSSDTRAAERL